MGWLFLRCTSGILIVVRKFVFIQKGTNIMTKKTVYVDMDNVLVDFDSGIHRLPAHLKDKYAGKYDETPGIFALMDPMPGAIEAYHELSNLFDTYILSTAPWHNPSAWSDKIIWVQRHLDPVAHKRLILSHNKHLQHGDFLIDDRTKNGADKFRGRHVHFGQPEFPDWDAVMVFMRQQV